jgi:hypothetical protein
MADMERIVVTWTGLSGLPGVSVFYGDLAGSANADIKTFFTAIAGLCPLGLTWTIPGNGDLIEDTTGALSGTWVNGAGGGSVAASGAAQHASGVGAYINWRTGAVVSGRRLMGRTFIAPLMNSAYDSSGNIVTGNLTTLQTAASALVTAGSTLIWHRPGAGAGSSHQPVSATVPDQVTSLRTRRR